MLRLTSCTVNAWSRPENVGPHCRGEVSHLEREIDGMKRSVDNERKKADDLIRERDLLNKLKTQAEHATHKQMDLIKINENTKRNLEQEMNGYKLEAQKQAKVGTALLLQCPALMPECLCNEGGCEKGGLN